MTASASRRALRRCVQRGCLAALATAALALPLSLSAQSFPFGLPPRPQFYPGNLVVSRSVYDNRAANVTVGEILPPNCVTALCSAPGGAISNGTYPYVFNNDIYDASFGITSQIYLDQITPSGFLLNSLEVPNSLEWSIKSTSDQLVTSFSSKSELGLHLSTDGRYLTFMGYVAPVNAIDVSNSNTPGNIDPTNPVPSAYYRAAARVDAFGRFDFTETTAYSGNNGRAAILNDSDGNNLFYSAGNAGNGSNPQPYGVVLGAGGQIFDAVHQPEAQQAPGEPTPVASFSILQLAGVTKADKVGKDDNFRGMTVFNNVLYFTKGSGSNGVNTVYYVNTSSTPCANGIGIPAAGATLPTTPLAFDPSTVTTDGLPSNMCILRGFPALSNKSTTVTNYPFGLGLPMRTHFT